MSDKIRNYPHGISNCQNMMRCQPEPPMTGCLVMPRLGESS
jgi:hypothetical protein